MKKIKSKLIYVNVNPHMKYQQKHNKSPSPDTKNRSKILSTQSPIKQVEQYYNNVQRINNNKIVYHCDSNNRSIEQHNKYQTQVKCNKAQQHHSNKSIKSISAFSLNNNNHSNYKQQQQSQQCQQIDIKSISQSIKLKSPQSSISYQLTPQHHNTASNYKQQYFPSTNTPKYHTPKYNKSLQEQHNYSKQYYQTQVKQPSSSLIQSPSNNNKKSKKKLQVYSPLINSIKIASTTFMHKPTNDSPSQYNINQNIITTNQHQKDHQKDHIINRLQHQLEQKNKEIQKMSIYMSEYQKLGQKNKKLQKDMKQILTKLIEMKSKKQSSLKINHSINNHNYNQLSSAQYKDQYHMMQNQNNEEQSLSQVQRENFHQHHQNQHQQQKKTHKKSLTDDYIKIYDDLLLQSSNNNNIQQQQQSYKPNLMKYSQPLPSSINKNNNITSSSPTHRKMLSVGARLKQSLHAKNQDFKASFDDSILLSSSSSQKLSSKLISPTHKNNNVHDFTKKSNKHFKTQQTQQCSVGLKQHDTTYKQYESFSSIQNSSNLYEDQQQSSTPKIKIIDHLQYPNTQQQTTIKKPKKQQKSYRYSIKKKPLQQQQQYHINHLIQTNKKLTSIIQNLMKSHDSMFLQVKRMSQKNQIYLNKMTMIQSQFSQIKTNFNQLTLCSQQLLKTVKQNYGNTTEFTFKNTLMEIQQKVSKLYQSIYENTKQMKRQNSQKLTWLQGNHNIVHSTTPYLSKINSFGKEKSQQYQKEEKEKKVRKQSGSQYKQPASPSFTYLEESASFLTDSFKLSQTDRSNPSNSRIHYSSNIVQDHINNPKSLKQSQKKVPKYEQESKILIIQDSVYGSSESNLLSNGTSQFIQVDSGRGVSQKSGTSRDKIKSENSQIRINFDDLDEDSGKYKVNLEIIERKEEIRSSNVKSSVTGQNNVESVELMKSSFGPIIQKQMSRSEKGDSLAGQIQDEVHGVDFANNDSPQKAYNRPRQNSSINIFFSSDSICKTNKVASIIPNDLPHYYYKSAQQNKSSSNNNASSSQQSSSFNNKLSAKCAQCSTKDEQIKALQTQAGQMRCIITQLTQQKDKLQKLIKSKVTIIDNLQLSLKQLQSLTSLEQIKSRKYIVEPVGQVKESNLMAGNDNKKIEQNSYPYYNSVNNSNNNNESSSLGFKNTYQYSSNSQQNKYKPQQKSSLLALKPIRFEQIQDLLPISKQLPQHHSISKYFSSSSQLPSYHSIQHLRQIQQQIQRQLQKQQQLERQLNAKHRLQRGDNNNDNSLDWTKGSFSRVDEFRQQSFTKTKAILIKLISLVRQFIAEGGTSTTYNSNQYHQQYLS